jgi:hypothetical protein
MDLGERVARFRVSGMPEERNAAAPARPSAVEGLTAGVCVVHVIRNAMHWRYRNSTRRKGYGGRDARTAVMTKVPIVMPTAK